MKPIALALMLSLFALPATAAGLTSDYTRLDQDVDCTVLDEAGEGDGDWADLECPGYGDYTYLIRYGDGRETVTYGYADDAGMPSFSPFNYSNGVVEWRLRRMGGEQVPVAAIQRWYLADQDGDWATQILVVSKVGQPGEEEACVIGYVAGADGAEANERARDVSEDAEDFRCGRDEPYVDDEIAEFVPPPQ